MTARMVAVLWCDRAGCDARFHFSDDRPTWQPPRLWEARRAARAAGWSYGVRLRVDSGPAPSFDYCPEHAADVHAIHEVSV